MKRLLIALSIAFVCSIVWAGQVIVVVVQPTTTAVSPGAGNLVAWWDFESSLEDGGAGNHDLTSFGGAATYTDSGSLPGTGYENVNNHYLYAADNAAFEPGSGSWSVSAWVYLNDATPSGTWGIVSKYNATGDLRSWALYQVAAGNTAFSVSSDGTATTLATVTSTGTRSDATWFHVVAVYVPSTSLKIYINGTAQGTNTTSIPASASNQNTQLNVTSLADSTTNEMQGIVDSVALFNDALNDSEVTWLYNGGLGRSYADL